MIEHLPVTARGATNRTNCCPGKTSPSVARITKCVEPMFGDTMKVTEQFDQDTKLVY